MSAPLATRLRLTRFVLLAVLGTWLGHGVEYARVAGARGLVEGLNGPLHTYMIPAGAILGGLAFLFASDVMWAWRRLDQRSVALRRRVRSAVGFSADDQPQAVAEQPSIPLRPSVFFLALASTQVALYLLQENVEAAVAGAPAPGLAALTGPHWAAPLVHVAIAATITIAVVLCRRAFTARLRRVEALQALIVLLLRTPVAASANHADTSVEVEPTWRAATRAQRGPPQPAIA